jgi:uncharacterized membrane protein YqiK
MFITIVVLLVILGLVCVAFIGLFIRKIQPGRAGVKTGWGGINVSFD